MDSLKSFFKDSLLGKIVGTIFAFVWILNLFPTWFGVDEIFSSNVVLKIVSFILAVIFWIPGIIISIWWIWFA